MKLKSPYINIYLQMQRYGIVLGGITGALVVFALMSPMILENPLYLGYVAFLSAPVGGFAGLIFGAVIGCITGLSMMVITAVCFKRIRDANVYRVMMGLLVFVFTTGVVIHSTTGGTSTLMPESEFLRPLYIAIILAVYVSQIVARKHLADIRVRKSKAYAQ